MVGTWTTAGSKRPIPRTLTRSISLVALLTVVLVSVSCERSDGAIVESPQVAEVRWHPQQERSGNSGAVDGAWAELVRYEEGISFQVHAEDLIPGNAYTLWLVVTNEPSACVSNPCPGPELIGVEETDSQVVYAGGHVAGGSRSTFAGSVGVGPLEGWLPDRSLGDPMTVEVQLVVNDHGPALDEHMPGMIDTYRGGCSDESPFPPFFPDTALTDGEVGPNDCLLYQMAAFLAP